MSGEFTRVSDAGMQQGIAALQKAADNLEKELNDLQSKLKVSLAEWAGAATEAYQEVQRRWDSQYMEMQNIVSQMRTSLTQITDNYASNEKKVQGRWG